MDCDYSMLIHCREWIEVIVQHNSHFTFKTILKKIKNEREQKKKKNTVNITNSKQIINDFKHALFTYDKH